MNTEYQTLLPDCNCKSGGIIMYNNKPVCRWCRKPYGNGGVMYYLPEHFEQPIKEERIEVLHVGYYKSNDTFFEFQLNKTIPEDKFPLIKQAIEQALNNDTVEDKRGENYWNGFEFACQVLEDMGYDRHTKHPYLLSDCVRAKCNKIKGEIRPNPFYEKFKIKWSVPIQEDFDGKKYTQSQVDTIRKEAFKAAREISLVEGDNRIIFNEHYIQMRNSFINCSKYCSYEAYEKTLNSLPKEQSDNSTGKDYHKYEMEMLRGDVLSNLGVEPPTPSNDIQEGKDWEIVELQEWYVNQGKPNEKGYIYPVSVENKIGPFSNAMSVDEWVKTQPPIYTIYSVKRSDGIIFNVGSEWGNCKIISFKLIGNDIEVYFSNNVESMDLMFLSPPITKLPPTKEDSWDNWQSNARRI